jgi:hypothetical protein
MIGGLFVKTTFTATSNSIPFAAYIDGGNVYLNPVAGNTIVGQRADNGVDKFQVYGLTSLGAIANTTTWNPNNVLPASFLSIQPGTLNDATTAASGTVSTAYVAGMTTPTLSATNTSVTYNTAYSFFINAAPFAGTNVTITKGYGLGVSAPAFISTVVSSAPVETSTSTLTLSYSTQDYVFTGTTSTWTLPLLASNQGVRWYIKNAGSGTVTINVSGSDHIYSTSQVTTYSLTAGTAIILIGGPTNYYIE